MVANWYWVSPSNASKIHFWIAWLTVSAPEAPPFSVVLVVVVRRRKRRRPSVPTASSSTPIPVNSSNDIESLSVLASATPSSLSLTVSVVAPPGVFSNSKLTARPPRKSMSKLLAPREISADIPPTMTSSENTAAIFLRPMKSNSRPAIPGRLFIFNCSRRFLRSQMSNSSRPTNSAVNMLITIPMNSVTAKPRTWSVPIMYNTTATSSVVTLASTIVVNARLNPFWIAIRTTPPRRCSSRIRSKINTLASTAIPIVSTSPASPGSVNVASMKIIVPITSNRFSSRQITATTPEKR